VGPVAPGGGVDGLAGVQVGVEPVAGLEVEAVGSTAVDDERTARPVRQDQLAPEGSGTAESSMLRLAGVGVHRL